MKLFARLAINAIALWVAATVVSGIRMDAGLGTILLIALVFGVVNAFLKPIAILLSLPALILTLGLFAIVINAAMLGLTAALFESFQIDGFWSAVVGALVVSLVSWVLSMLLSDDG